MKLYFAGGEAWSNLLLDMGVKYQLFSYFYFRTSLRSNGSKARQLLARLRRAKEAGYGFMLDSGAFTYQVKQGSNQQLPPPRAYFEEYKSFISKFGDLFDVIADLDIAGVKDPETDRIIDIGKVDDWTNELLTEFGWKIMPVWHASYGSKWLRDWLLDTGSPYVGFASDAQGAGQFISAAHRFGKAVHGFGQTRIKTDLKYTPFDSVDSTTWLRADKFGGTCIFRNGKWIVLDHLHKADRRLYRDYFESWGLDFKKIMEDDLHELRLSTIIAWRELANHFERQTYVRTSGKQPYLLEMALKGTLPKTHPLIKKKLKEREQLTKG